MKNKRGFTLAETLLTISIIGIICALLIGFTDFNNNKSVNITKYRKIYDNLEVALKDKLLKSQVTGLKMAFTNNPDQMIDMISEKISTQEKFEGCKYGNLKTLIGDSACNSTNVKGAVLADGTPISFIAENEATDLTNQIITKHGNSIQKGLVGAIVVNNDNKTLDTESIIPVYENGLGALVVSKTGNVFSSAFNSDDKTQNKNNCETIDHVWLNNECKTPSKDVCKAIGKNVTDNKCSPPTEELCNELGKILFQGECRHCSSDFIDGIKEAYNILQNAILKSEQVNGSVSTWTYNADGWRAGNPPNATFFATTYIVPFLDVDYTCTYSNSSKKCFYGPKNEFYGKCGLSTSVFESSCKGLQTITTYAGAGQSYMFRLKNGMSVAISEYTKDVRIVVDIDGPTKGESVTGFDVFEFTITKSGGFKAYPGEWSNGQLNCSLKQYGNPCSGAQHTGGGQSSCAAYIINKNWKRPDDYPYCHE